MSYHLKHPSIVAAAVLPLLAALLAGCGTPRPPDQVTQASPAVRVTLAIASKATIGEPLDAGGTVAARESATLTSRIVAPVVAVRVRAGDRVKAGDVLVVLDDADLAARARQAEASIAAAQQGLAATTTDQSGAAADRRLAAAWQGRVSSLHTRRSATTQELDEADARLAGADARLAGAEARVAGATAQLAAARAASEAATATAGFALIRAPFDGIVTERLLDPGNVASPGSPILRLDSLGPAHVEVRIDEAREQYIRPGDRVEVQLDDAGPAAAPVVSAVIEVARAIGSAERTFTVTVSLPADRAARTGTFARVRFRGPSREALLIPSRAIRRQGQLATAFVVQDGLARLRMLQTGYEGREGVEVLAGLDPGERIVTDPPPDLTDGRRVVEGRPQARVLP